MNQKSLSYEMPLDSDPQRFATSSIRLIKKNFVKDQRKQFEKANEVTSNPLSWKAESVKSRSNVQKHDISKSKSFLSLAPNPDSEQGTSHNMDADALSSKQPFYHLPIEKAQRTVAIEQRLSMFENSDKGVLYDLPSKPNIQPKPGYLTARNPDVKLIGSVKGIDENEVTIAGLPQVISLATAESNSQTTLTDSALKSVFVSSTSHKPLVMKEERDTVNAKSLNRQAKILRRDGVENIVGYRGSPERKADLRSPGNPVENLNINFKVFGKQTETVNMSLSSADTRTATKSPNSSNSGLASAGILSPLASPPIPPPKPPRLLAELMSQTEQSTSERKENLYFKGQPVKTKGYEHLRDTTSVIKVKDMLAQQKEVPASSSDKNVCPPKKELPDAQKKLSIDRKKLDQWWESKFIRVPQSNILRSKEKLKTKQINNPSYMYAKVSQPDDIIIGCPLVRHRSDELLDSTQSHHTSFGQFKSHYDDGPIYHDPVSVVKQRRSNRYMTDTVRYDTDGYAIPTLKRNANCETHGAVSSQINAKKTRTLTSAVKQEDRTYVKSKVSNAYSILRLPVMFPGDQKQPGHDEDGEVEVDLEEHLRLLRHVSSVKFKTNEAVVKYETVRLASTHRLFQYAMIIGLHEDTDSGEIIPKILLCFPEEMKTSEKLTASFCFPDANSLLLQNTYEGETFAFILTSSTGDRRYGLCKRYLPPGSRPRLPEALCVVSPIGDATFYGHFLEAVKESRFLSMGCAEEMIRLAYSKPFPEPNHEVYLQIPAPNSKKRPLILKRASESRMNTVEFSLLLSHLSVTNLIKVFSAVLLERKIIFLAKNLSTLSSCSCALVELLYPFEWQHTFVTVLPSNLIDIIHAPTPYILGILSSPTLDLNETISELNEALVVDLDSDSFLRMVGDESRIIPRKLQKALTSALSDDLDGQRGRIVRDVTVAEAFLRLFVETCGHYTEYIVQQNSEKVFQRELFVKAVLSRSIKFFLEWFTQTQMFGVFITSRLNDDETHGYFEQQIIEYRQEMEESTSALGNMKAVGRKIADFFRGSGDKIKKTIQKAVYI